MKTKLIIILTGILLIVPSFVMAEDNPPATTEKPLVEARANLPEGFVDTGCFDYGIPGANQDSGFLLINTSAQLTNEKFDQVDFVNRRRGTGKKDWSMLRPNAEKMLRDIMNLDGVVDFSASPYQIAIQKGPRFSWDDLIPAIEKRVDEALCQ